METELTKRNLTVVQFKKKYPRTYSKILDLFGGKRNIFDFTAAFTLFINDIRQPTCEICCKPLAISKKYRNINASRRCNKHINTHNIIDITEVQEKIDYQIISYPDKQLTKSDNIIVRCATHGEYSVKIANLISGMQCQKCYFESTIGKPGVVHSNKTKKKLSEAKLGKPINLSRKAKERKTIKQKQAWVQRKNDKEAYNKYIRLLSHKRKAYIKENGFRFPAKEKTGLEVRFEDFLNAHNVCYEMQYLLENKRFDFYLRDLNLLVEVDGEYWHRKESSIKNDKTKHLLCIKNNVELVRISSDNFYPEIIFEDRATRQNHTRQILLKRGIDGF